MIREKVIQTPIGAMLAKANQKAILSLAFVDENYEAEQNENGILNVLAKQLNEYFMRKRESFDLPLMPQGTDFEVKIWKELQNIPYGETISYKEEAIKIENPKAWRAVANANGKNPIPIIIPCHRVIASGGNIGGYARGIWRKEFLLELEGCMGIRKNCSRLV